VIFVESVITIPISAKNAAEFSAFDVTSHNGVPILRVMKVLEMFARIA
jgi:hypothetical protein